MMAGRNITPQKKAGPPLKPLPLPKPWPITPSNQRTRDHVIYSDIGTATSEGSATSVTQSTPRYQLRARKDSLASETPSRRCKRVDSSSNNESSRILFSPATPSSRDGRNGRNSSSFIFNGKPSTGSRRFSRTMSNTAGKWREDQILIICPGSRTTMAQLGCNELTPPAHRLPTRMFRDGNEWRPYHTFRRTKMVNGVEEEEWVEDVDEDKGAVWPIEGGRIVNMDALLAFLDHVHGLLTTTYHNTPIMLMASPQWTRPDCETIAQYIFEKTRTPGLSIIHSGIATQYGLKWPNMTVVDIGFEKVDVTAIHDGRVVNHNDLGAPKSERQVSGGDVFTRKLLQLLEGKGFNRDMVEQLKKSNICEVLPYAPNAEKLMELPVENTAGVSSSAAALATQEATAVSSADAPRTVTGIEPIVDGEDEDLKADDDGVLDVAAIVTTGQTKEFLAKREKEKSKPGRKGKGDKDGEATAARHVRLPNSKRTHNTFFFEEVIQEEVPKVEKEKKKGTPTEAPAATATENAPKEGETNGTDGTAPPPPQTGGAPKDEEASKAPEPEGDKPEADSTTTAPPKPEEKPAEGTIVNDGPPEVRPKRVRRDIEVGLERFTFAEREEIDRIVTTIYRTIQGIDDMYMRPACWENLVFVGNGARLRGLKENIVQTLNARHLVSPSTATMFTSELPSNVATPTGTGAQTPTGSFTGAPHQLPASGVNPLLQAATTASLNNSAGGAAAVATPQAASDAGGPVVGHHFHSQTPTSIKTASLPTYLSEWTKNGFEEVMFLGAQVAARIAFCLHSNMDAQSVEAQRLMSLSRVDYNELGPKGIRTHSMLG